VRDVYGAGYADEDDVEVHGCTAALSFQIGYQFGVLCLGMLNLPLGPCVFTVLHTGVSTDRWTVLLRPFTSSRVALKHI